MRRFLIYVLNDPDLCVDDEVFAYVVINNKADLPYELVEHLNGNIHYQMFCGVMIDPSSPITNYKIVSAICNEIASRLDIDSFQEILASHWKPYLENLHVCMTDATCYESHIY